MTDFGSVKIVGGLLPADLLGRVFAGDSQVPGTGPDTYGLERGESVRRQASRSWLYLVEVWQDFQRRIDNDESGTGARSARVTRERWLHILLRELGFHQVAAEGGIELDGKNFPVSHRSGHVPVHLLGWSTDLDHKTPHVTARAPQSMVQELLNRDDSFLWAILSNGAVLRLLRDSTTLVGSSYVEFDLAAIFDGELFSDFVLLYLICHESRFAIYGDGGPASCYLEQWRGFAAEQGERALDQLRDGVKEAISILGTGFLSHPDNPQLRTRLDPRNADLKLDDFNRALLRLVYRLLFWFVAEDRGALLEPNPDGAGPDAAARLRQARDRYATYFSSARLRQLARRRRGGRHGDLFQAAELVFDALGTEGGVPELALAGIGGIFESKGDDGKALPLDEPLGGARLSNEALLGAVRALSLVTPRGGGGRRRVDFGNLGAEELGSVYESLLELIPRYDDEQLAYTLENLSGNERKESGSYYTPTSLVECLLDSALDPLLDEACRRLTTEDRVAALLDITVCDPACGSGHFLVAAARRIAKRVAAEEAGEPEPADAVVRAALRRVVGRCIHGVDINPMAAELAKVSLWLEALEPGKPLSYLDENIRVGNSLLGVSPALLAEGLPDAAFSPIEGDDRKVASALKKQNAAERAGQHDLFNQSGIPVTNAVLARRAAEIARALPDSLEDLHIHQQRQARELALSDERRVQKLLADAWCGAFVQPKTAVTRSTTITHAVLERLGADSGTLETAATEVLVADLTRQYRFFHWHVEFPHIFRVGTRANYANPATGWSGGFSCILGNPPWERPTIREQEFFAARHPVIASMRNAAKRKQAIENLADSKESVDRDLYADFMAALKKASGSIHFLRVSERYPFTGRGEINTYAVFAENGRAITNPNGNIGFIIPTGIATDATTQYFFKDVVSSSSLVSLYDFENAKPIFPGVHRSYKFCLLTLTNRANRVQRALFAFFLREVNDLAGHGAVFSLDPKEIDLLNPNTHTLPIFRTRRDAEITLGVYRRIPVAELTGSRSAQWQLRPTQMFHVTHDAGYFESAPSESTLPLLEGRLVHQFNHRWATYEHGEIRGLTPNELADPSFRIHPRYWVDSAAVRHRLDGRWSKPWLLVWRGIASTTNERTVVAAVIPPSAANNKIPIITGVSSATDAVLLLSAMNSFVFDYIDRQKQPGVTLNTFILQQLPVPSLIDFQAEAIWNSGTTIANWIQERATELVYSSFELEEFARELGDSGSPFQWDEDRRSATRAELDAAFFHIYGIGRDDLEYVLESFPIVKRKDVERCGSFHTKELILDVYDAMAEAIRTGEPYQTILDPPPGHGPRHPDRTDGGRHA